MNWAAGLVALSRRDARALPGWWPFAAAAVPPLALFAKFLVGASTLYWGTPLLQFYPWHYAAWQMLRAGQWPVWNDLVGNGAPLLANYQSALLYPPNWLGLLLPLGLAQNWLVALHLAWAGAGMVALARRLGLQPLGQAVAGLAFGLSQYLVARAGFFSINAAAAWLPWLVWAVERLWAADTLRGRVRAALWLALLAALQLLAGHAQSTWYTWLLCGAWSVWRALWPPRAGAGPMPLRGRAGVLGLAAGALALAALLAAAQLAPTFEYMQASPRAEEAGYEFAATYSFSPWRLLTLLAPDLLGNPARGRFYGYGNYWEDAVYAGVLPLLLAVGVLWRAFTRRDEPARGLARFLLGVMAVSVLLGLGRNTPVFPFFYNYVPTFDLFQAPARMLIWLVFGLALLGGLGADRWQAPEGRALYWTRLGTAGAVSVILIGLAGWRLAPNAGPLADQLRTVARAVALAGLLLLAAGALSLLKPRLGPGAWRAAVVGVLAADLLWAGWGLNPGGPADLYHGRTQTGAALSAALDAGAGLSARRLFQYPSDEAAVRYDRFLSFEAFGPVEDARHMRLAQLPNVAALDGLSAANNFDPFVPARYARLVQAADDTRSEALLRLMNAGVLASREPLAWPKLAEAEAAGVGFYAVPGEPRRVWVVYTAARVPDGDVALAAITQPDFDPAAAVVLEENDAGVGAAPALTPALNTVTIPVTLDRPGWVVLADTYYPGWHVYVDGQPATLLRGNYAFRAVAVEPGAHTVMFVYRPRSLSLGVGLSAVGALLVVLAAAWAWRLPRMTPRA